MTDYGKLTGPAELEFKRRFEAPPATVWQFLVDPEKRKLWFCGGSTDDFVGGKVKMDFDHRRISESPPPEKYASEEVAQHEAEILEYEPNRRLAFTWFESAGAEHSIVEISLRAIDDNATELHLVHKGVVGREMLLGVFAGWHGHFDLLGEVVVGPRKSDFWIRDQQLEAEYDQLISSS